MSHNEISLYECSNAKVKGDAIVCEKGHKLGVLSGGAIGILRLARGDALQLKVCKSCTDFDRNGPPIPKEERGWAKV